LIDEKTISHYLSREMATLGIGFLFSSGSNQSVSAASISLEQLMKTINSISEQFEEIFKRWYEVVLKDKGYDPSYAPDIKILDSEALEIKLKMELAKFLYSILNLSMKTTLSVLGYDAEEEKQIRDKENKDGYDTTFYPRAGSFNAPSNQNTDKKAGRPEGEENDKQGYDENYNDNARPNE
jgi:hypothetical protein